MNERTKLIEWINLLITIAGTIAIPGMIYFTQTNQTDRIEFQNRKVGVAQLLSDNYAATCEQRLATSNLIEEWLTKDLSSDANDPFKDILLKYLRIGLASENQQESNQACIAAIEDEVLRINNLTPESPSQAVNIQPDGASADIISKNRAVLSSFKIAIHYLSSDTSLEEEAQKIKEILLQKAGFSKNQLTVRGLSKDWFDIAGGLSSDQIRFEEGSENQAAIALKEILEEVYQNRSFKLQKIRGTSPNYISIFLK